MERLSEFQNFYFDGLSIINSELTNFFDERFTISEYTHSYKYAYSGVHSRRFENILIYLSSRDENIKNQLLQKSFVLIPYTFALEGMVLTGIESSYGVSDNTYEVGYTLWGVDASGTAQPLIGWTHPGNTKFAESINWNVNSQNWDNKYLYVTGNQSVYDGVGFTVTAIFTNSNCAPK